MELDCPGCGVVLRLKDEYLGRQVKCPKCGTSLLVAEPVPPSSLYEDDPLFTITPGLMPPPVHQSLRPQSELPPLPAYLANPTAPRPPVSNPNYPASAPPTPIYSTHGSSSIGSGNSGTGYRNQGNVQQGHANPNYGAAPGFGPASGEVGVGVPAHATSPSWGGDQSPPGNAPYASPKSWSMSPGKIALGLLMMLGAMVWFVVGLANDRIFLYPPILFILGIGTVIKGCLGQVE